MCQDLDMIQFTTARLRDYGKAHAKNVRARQVQADALTERSNSLVFPGHRSPGARSTSPDDQGHDRAFVPVREHVNTPATHAPDL